MKWLTLLEAAERTGYSVRTLERYIKAGRLPAYVTKAGARVRVKSSDVDALFVPLVLS